MKKSHPLDQLQSGVLDDSVPLAKLLRQVVIIGGNASSEALQAWALRELQGYTDRQVELPDYRKLHAPLQADFLTATGLHKGWTISVLDLPENTRKDVSEEVPMSFSVRQIEALISDSDPAEPVKLTPLGSAELIRMMTLQRRGQGVEVLAVYWSLHVSALQDILDQVRTRLTQFVAALRTVMPEGQHEPTPDQVQRVVQTINIVTTGDNSPVSVTAPVAYAEQDARAVALADESPRRLWWRQR